MYTLYRRRPARSLNKKTSLPFSPPGQWLYNYRIFNIIVPWIKHIFWSAFGFFFLDVVCKISDFNKLPGWHVMFHGYSYKKFNFSISRTKVVHKASHYHADMAEGQCTLRMVSPFSRNFFKHEIRIFRLASFIFICLGYHVFLKISRN